MRYGRREGGIWSFENLSQTASPNLGVADRPLDLLVEEGNNGPFVTVVWRGNGGLTLRSARKVGSGPWKLRLISSAASLTPVLAAGKWPGSSIFRSGPSVVWIDDATNETRVADYGVNSFLPTVAGWSGATHLSWLSASPDGQLDGVTIAGDTARILQRIENPGTAHTLGVLTVRPFLIGSGNSETFQGLFSEGIFQGGYFSAGADGVPYYLYARRASGDFEAQCYTTRGRGSWTSRSLHFDPSVPPIGPVYSFPGTTVFATAGGNSWRAFTSSNGVVTLRTSAGPGLFYWKETRLLNSRQRGYVAVDFLPDDVRIEAYADSVGSLRIRKFVISC